MDTWVNWFVFILTNILIYGTLFIHTLLREKKEQQAQIKQLEKELKECK